MNRLRESISRLSGLTSCATAALAATAASAAPPCSGDWTVTPTPDPADATSSNLQDVTRIADDDIWAVGHYMALVVPPYNSDQLTLTLHWDGAAWNVVPSPSPAVTVGGAWCSLNAVGAAASNEVYAAGGQRIQGPGGYLGTHMLVMEWDGSSWRVLDTPLPPNGDNDFNGISGDKVRDIEVFGPDDVWFFGDWVEIVDDVGVQRPLAMHYDGSSFTITETIGPDGFPAAFVAGSALAPDDIWAVGGGGDGDYVGYSVIYHWDGSQWNHVPGPTPGYYHRLYDVVAVASNDVWAVGDYADESGYHNMALHWDGSSWTMYEGAVGGRALLAFGSDDVYSASAGVSHWDGSNWTAFAGTEEFEGSEFPAFMSLIRGDGCDLWGVGRELGAQNELRSFAATFVPSETSPEDVDGDGVVGITDLLAVLAAWGSTGGSELPEDVNGDGEVNITDLLAVLAAWG